MKLARNIKIKSFPWTVLPLFSTYTAHAIYPNIYLPKSIYENLRSKRPDHRNVATLIHEQTHIERQKEIGWFIWGFKYCFFPSFRFREELEAIKGSMKYMKKKKENWNTERSAHILSSYLYLWCVSFKDAKRALNKAWSEA